MDDTLCSICKAPVARTSTTCARCGAQHGYRDGKGTIRTKSGVLMIMALSTAFGLALFWLSSIIPLWYYFYPLAFFGGLMILGTVLFAVLLLRGPKWYRS